MLCGDAETLPAELARKLADRALNKQWRTVGRAIQRVLKERLPIQRFVLSGSGEIVGRSVCARSKLASLPITSLSAMLGVELSQAACAYAVALLAAQVIGHGR